MTKEEKISALRVIRADYLKFDDANAKDKYDALTMVIKELEQSSSRGGRRMRKEYDTITILDDLLNEEAVEATQRQLALKEAIESVKNEKRLHKIMAEWEEMINHIRYHMDKVTVSDKLVQSIYQTGEEHILEIVEYHYMRTRRD